MKQKKFTKKKKVNIPDSFYQSMKDQSLKDENKKAVKKSEKPVSKNISEEYRELYEYFGFLQSYILALKQNKIPKRPTIVEKDVSHYIYLALEIGILVGMIIMYFIFTH